MPKVLAINGSYRAGGIIDQAVGAAIEGAQAAGAEVECVNLRDYPVEFCLNCRACTQKPGEAPGTCVINDGMAALIAQIEAADGYILASPTNYFTVTAIYKRFLERTVVYGYWPWGAGAPENRKKNLTKKAVLIASSAMPGILGRLTTSTLRLLRAGAEVFGAKSAGSLYLGLIALEENRKLSEKQLQKARELGRKAA